MFFFHTDLNKYIGGSLIIQTIELNEIDFNLDRKGALHGFEGDEVLGSLNMYWGCMVEKWANRSPTKE